MLILDDVIRHGKLIDNLFLQQLPPAKPPHLVGFQSMCSCISILICEVSRHHHKEFLLTSIQVQKAFLRLNQEILFCWHRLSISSVASSGKYLFLLSFSGRFDCFQRRLWHQKSIPFFRRNIVLVPLSVPGKFRNVVVQKLFRRVIQHLPYESLPIFQSVLQWLRRGSFSVGLAIGYATASDARTRCHNFYLRGATNAT